MAPRMAVRGERQAPGEDGFDEPLGHLPGGGVAVGQMHPHGIIQTVHEPSPEDGAVAQTAARALLAVLDHTDVATHADERLFEALLLYGLRGIPAFGDTLFGSGPEVDFKLGRRGTQADIVGTRGAQIVVEYEVKIRSNLNWQKDGGTQLDEYAAHAPKDARLFLLTTEIPHEALAGYLQFRSPPHRSGVESARG